MLFRFELTEQKASATRRGQANVTIQPTDTAETLSEPLTLQDAVIPSLGA